MAKVVWHLDQDEAVVTFSWREFALFVEYLLKQLSERGGKND